jgi:branched-chain amino acid transport system permease protein
VAAAAFAFYFVQQWFWPAPLGVLVQGILIGGLTAMLAIGISLVYRANRVINFAQADLGGVGATLAVLLIVAKHWPYPLAIGTGLLAGAALGGVFELLVVRRFFKAPRLILTAVTIFMLPLLVVGEAALPSAFHLKSPPQNFKSPFDFTFDINPIVFHGNDVLAMVTIPVVIVALICFFRFTSIGIAVRASSESADRASLLGVPVRRINTVVWILASTLATIALILRAGVVGLPIGSALGYPILVRALAAAVIGKMEKLPTIFVASLGIGVLEQAIVWSTRRGILVDPILFLVIIGALLLQRRNASARTEDQAMSSWTAAKEVRPVPRELIDLPEVRWGLRAASILLGLVVVLLPFVLGEGRTNLVASLFTIAIVAVSLVVLTGWAGLVSLGQFAFVGVGAAVGAYLTLERGWDLSIVLVASGTVGAGLAVLIGLPALRIRGLFLAVATLSFALAMSSYGLNSEFLHWVPSSATRIERPALFGRVALNTETRMYYLCLVCLLLALAAVRALRQTRTGRVLIAVRENERGAQSFGINVTRAKLTAFALSGFLAAFAGALFVHLQQNLLTTSYTPEASVQVFLMVVIGGLGSVPGAILGATYVQSLSWFRNAFPPGVRPYLGLLGSGLGATLVLMFLPEGLGSLLYRLRDRLLKVVADRRGIVVPSLLADVRVEHDDGPLVVGSAEEQVDFGSVVTTVEEAVVADEHEVVAVPGGGA